jgi:hypothetical protein
MLKICHKNRQRSANKYSSVRYLHKQLGHPIKTPLERDTPINNKIITTRKGLLLQD